MAAEPFYRAPVAVRTGAIARLLSGRAISRCRPTEGSTLTGVADGNPSWIHIVIFVSQVPVGIYFSSFVFAIEFGVDMVAVIKPGVCRDIEAWAKHSPSLAGDESEFSSHPLFTACLSPPSTPRPLDTRPISLPSKAVTRGRRKPPPSQSRLAVLILTESRHASSQTDASMKKWAELRKKEMEWILR